MASATAVIGEAAAGRLRVWALPALGLALFGLALWAIHRELDPHVLASVGDALAAMPWSTVAAATALAAVSYGCLALYDPLALHHVGRPLPLRQGALAGFIGYAFSHAMGLPLLTGGAVRYRLYSGWGLAAPQIAGVVAFNSLTLWVGVAAMLGLGALAAPGETAGLLGLTAGSARALG